MIEYKQINTTSYTLTGEGAGIVKNGSHEYRVWEVLPPAGGSPMAIPDLQVGHFPPQSLGWCMDEAD
jgi:phenylalanyl-tRNA synthetase alpha chain